MFKGSNYSKSRLPRRDISMYVRPIRCSWSGAVCTKEMTTRPHGINWLMQADWTSILLLDYIFGGLLLHLESKKYIRLKTLFSTWNMESKKYIRLKTLFSTCIYVLEQVPLPALPPPECRHQVRHHDVEGPAVAPSWSESIFKVTFHLRFCSAFWVFAFTSVM